MPLVDIAHVENQSFDYIIIGGGTAGLTLAARLAEDAKTSVLVLEAGNTNENDPAICRPAQWGSHFGQDAYSWSHATVPQKHAADRSIGLFRGRGLGGSSSINFSAWLQPQKHDIDGRLGKVGKCRMELWKILQICFSRYIASRQLLLVISYLSGFRYKAREVAVPGVTDDWSPPVSFTKTVPDFDVKFHQSMINAGMPRAKAPLTGDPYGAFFSTNSLDPVTNTRSYAGSVYFAHHQGLHNLSVLIQAYVTKVVLSDVHGEQVATGVEFMFSTEDQVRVVHANKEVILSAGTLKTPQILELSGIGRKTVLEQFGIPTLIDLPVGENIQEHIYVGVSVQLKDDIPDATLDELSIDGGLQKHLDLFTQGKGVFTMGLSNFAFFPLSDVSSRAKEIREAGIATSQRKIESGEYPIGAVTSLQMQANKLLRPALDCEITTMPAFLSGPNVPAAMKKHFTIFAMSNHTLSRGTIHLKSKDPRVDPAYDPCYFENPAALELLIELFKYIRKVTQLAPFKDCLDSEVNPGPNVQTDEQIRDWIKQTFSTTFHTIGACSMLPRAKGGVVDSSLKVYGCQNLRVVDISIAPLHVSAHTQTLAYAIAEQGAKVDFSVLNTVS
ncbi:GMC oxidoreductase [Mycena galericulata]|nr:GMC oxidoreductase [Mycena galericulata]